MADGAKVSYARVTTVELARPGQLPHPYPRWPLGLPVVDFIMAGLGACFLLFIETMGPQPSFVGLDPSQTPITVYR